ncbi:hypothetical protein [Bifidobacterium angulatum]
MPDEVETMNKIRNAVRPFAYVSMTILTVLSAAQMMWGFAALCFSGNIAAVRTQDAFLRLAGVDVFALENEPLQQTIVEIVIAALLCSCHSAWGAWAFSGGGDRWSWEYPRDIRLGATLLNIIMLIGAMHCVGVVSWVFSFSAKCAVLMFATAAVIVMFLYIAAYIGSRPFFVAFLLKMMQCVSILVTFIVLIQVDDSVWLIIIMLVSVVWCHLLDCNEPCLTVRWATAKQRILDLLGISVIEER